MSKIKILVAYHKPAKLYKSDVFVPIHVGRTLATQAVKDGKMSETDYQWMLDNMIGDDTGDNISALNLYFAELTAIYWAWKNYDKLGNPDYIGLQSCQQIFNREDIDNAINYDITAICEKNDKEQTKYIDNHFSNHLDEVYEHLIQKDEKYQKICDSYMNSKEGFFFNMFIMKKEIFFEYCELLFDILFKIHKNTDYAKLSFYNQRMPEFLAERLTGMFISYKEKIEHKNILRCQICCKDIGPKRVIKPVFKDNAIPVCLSADNNYAPYLSVMINSIKENNTHNSNYDICVLSDDISQINKKKILSLSDNRTSIRFIDIRGFLDDYDKKIFSLNVYFTIATYFRFFIPQIFAEYDKILYLDCDMVVNKDLYDLFHTNLDAYMLGAVVDFGMLRIFETGEGDIQKYLQQKLKMKHPEQYFQAGMLLLDVKKLIKFDFTKKCLEKLIELKDPLYLDQCTLNSIFDGNYKRIDSRWNVEWQISYFIKDLDKKLDAASYCDYMDSRETPFIVHYAGGLKPWNDPEVELACFWWKYARTTPFYEYFLSKLEFQRNDEVKNYAGNTYTKIYNLFDLIPVLKVTHKNRKKVYRIFNIPFLQLKQKNPKKKIKFYFLGIPIITIKRKYT